MASALAFLILGILVWRVGHRLVKAQKEFHRSLQVADLEEPREEQRVQVQFIGGPQDGRRMDLGKRPPATWDFPDVMEKKAVLAGAIGRPRHGEKIHRYQLQMTGGTFEYHYLGRRWA